MSLSENKGILDGVKLEYEKLPSEDNFLRLLRNFRARMQCRKKNRELVYG